MAVPNVRMRSTQFIKDSVMDLSFSPSTVRDLFIAFWSPGHPLNGNLLLRHLMVAICSNERRESSRKQFSISLIMKLQCETE